METITVRVFSHDADSMRRLIASWSPRICVTERRGWFFRHFTATGEQKYIEALSEAVDEWRAERAMSDGI